MRYSGPQLLSSWLHVASAEATKLPAPSQARAVGPAELTVRRRCPVGSRTTGVATAQRGSARAGECHLVRGAGGSGPRIESTKLTWNELEQETGHSPNMRYSGPQLLSSWLHGASAVGKQAASPLASSGRWAR
jgi:hypothetical protein